MLGRIPTRLFVSEGSLWAGHERIASIADVEQALVIPPPRPAVRLIARATRFELPVERHLNARETVDAIGLGPSRAPLRFRWSSRRIAPVRGLATLAAGGIASATATFVSAPLAWIVGAVALLSLGFTASYRPRVEIGCDGIFVVNGSGSCFVPYDIVRSISTGGIRLKNGRLVPFGAEPKTRDLNDPEEDDALVVLAIERIEHALSAARTHVQPVLVERLAVAAPDEIERIGVSYRDAPCSDEDLWTVLEDGRSPPRARINAASLLVRRLGSSARRRIAAAAHPTIRPDVREELEALLVSA